MMHDDDEDRIELCLFHLRMGIKILHELHEQRPDDIHYELSDARRDSESDEEFHVWSALMQMRIQPYNWEEEDEYIYEEQTKH